MDRARDNVKAQVELAAEKAEQRLEPAPSPFYSVLMYNCLETGRDISDGGVKYYNYGIHGSGSSNAADALAAVRKFVFEDKTIGREELLDALDKNFDGYDDLFRKLHDEGPKVGNNDDYVDSILARLFGYFADACEAAGSNSQGRIIRAGTGSAMYYVWLVRRGRDKQTEPIVDATADGRRRGDFIGSSLAPSPGVRVGGPVSVLQSFSKIDYNRVCNGGPITMELSDTVFRDEESVEKVAMLIRTFARIGCQQLQINTLNVERLRDAKKHPEQHGNLIVRVWGWSGYFVELDEPYQDHIISRHMLTL
jgi:formate C-acetyltransferase